MRLRGFLYLGIMDLQKIWGKIQAGEQIPCWVDFRFNSNDKEEAPCRDIAKARKNAANDTVSIGVRGIEYTYVLNYSLFAREVERLNIVFVGYDLQPFVFTDWLEKWDFQLHNGKYRCGFVVVTVGEYFLKIEIEKYATIPDCNIPKTAQEATCLFTSFNLL